MKIEMMFTVAGFIAFVFGMVFSAYRRMWIFLAAFGLLVVFASQSYAGYYARVNNYVPTMQYTQFPVATVSGCYLTPSMAIASLGGGGTYFVVTSIDSGGTWSVRGTTGAGGSASGVFAECDVTPSVFTLPNMDGGVTDPAISGGSIISGGGMGGGGADASAVAALQAEVSALQAANTTMSAELGRIGSVQNVPFDLGKALAGTAFAFSTVLFFFGVSRAIGEVLRTIRGRRL